MQSSHTKYTRNVADPFHLKVVRVNFRYLNNLYEYPLLPKILPMSVHSANLNYITFETRDSKMRQTFLIYHIFAEINRYSHTEHQQDIQNFQYHGVLICYTSLLPMMLWSSKWTDEPYSCHFDQVASNGSLKLVPELVAIFTIANLLT